MDDHAIVALYWARDERALTETAAKFGAYCRKIAMNLLASLPDAEEVENDTWLAAWDSMPFADSSFGFGIVCGLILAICFAAAWVLHKKHML